MSGDAPHGDVTAGAEFDDDAKPRHVPSAADIEPSALSVHATCGYAVELTHRSSVMLVEDAAAGSETTKLVRRAHAKNAKVAIGMELR